MINNDEVELVSWCCHEEFIGDTDICSECLDHATPVKWTFNDGVIDE